MIKKLYISLLAVILSTITFSTATFAWLTMATVNRVDGFNLNSKQNSNLEISLDGINYADNIDENELMNYISNLKFRDVSSLDGLNFISRPTGDTDMIYPNHNYIQLDLYLRTTSRYHDVYLVNNVSNSITYANLPENGTFVTSKGVQFRSTVDFEYDIGVIRRAQETYTYYAKDAIRISFNELLTDNVYDTRDIEDLNHFIYDPSENEHRGFGKTYGSISYFNSVRYSLISVPTIIPNTLYHLTSFTDLNKYLPDNTTSKIMSLIETDNYTEDHLRYYEGKVRLTIWLEGYDADLFDAVFGDTLKIQLEFQSAVQI